MHFVFWICAVVVWPSTILVFDLVVMAVLRPFGVRVPLPLWTGRRQANVVLRPLGKFKYVLISGLLLLGWPMGAGMAAYQSIAHKYLGHFALTPIDALWLLTLWSAAGIAYGLRTWKDPGSDNQPYRVA